MQMAEARKALKRLINGRGQDWDLAEASLLIACEMDPELDRSGYLKRLDAWAAELGARTQGQPVDRRLDALAQFLGQEIGLTGNKDDYYDPANSFLNQVMDNKQGIPLSLSVIYLAVAERMGLPLSGIPLPGHFLVAPVGQSCYYDPFEGGRKLHVDDLQGILTRLFGDETRLEESMIRPMRKRQILARMVRNLKYIYAARGELKNLLWTTDLGLALEPGDVDLLKERGLVYYQMGRYSDALEDLQGWLKHSPQPDAEEEASEEEEDGSPARQHVELLYRVLSAMN